MAGPLPPGWTEHTAPTGHKYYYNAALKKSTYKRPTLEVAAEPPKPAQQETPPVVAPQQPVIQNTALNVRKQDHGVPLSEWSADAAVARPAPQSTGQAAPHRMTEEMWKKLEDRPRKKDDIPGAEPWVQVTTKWTRTFYHNPQTGESYWNIPESIRPIVEQFQIQAARATTLHSESDEEDESEEEYDSEDLPDEPEEEEQEKGLEMTEEDMYYQLAQMQEEFGDDGMEEDEEELDPATKRAAFISLLDENEVNPFYPWETEMPKIVHDPRYQMLKNTKARTDVFEEWSRVRIAAIKEEKSHQRKEDPKEAFLRFLTEKVDTQEYWFEFRKKNRKAPEFKQWGTEKQKEDLWRDWCARTKMSREKREAELLSWMRNVKGSREEVEDKVRMDVRYWVVGVEKEDIVRDALRARQ